MTRVKILALAWLALLAAMLPVLANATLPAPTPAQTQAAAARKAQAAEQDAKEKQELLAAMDAIAARWRAKAAAQGIKLHPPVAVAAQASAIAMPSTQTSASGQPGGRMGPAAREAPVRSEKSGTAAPSKDVKKAPSEPYKR
jgi:uncharacterized protein YkwD